MIESKIAGAAPAEPAPIIQYRSDTLRLLAGGHVAQLHSRAALLGFMFAGMTWTEEQALGCMAWEAVAAARALAQNAISAELETELLRLLGGGFGAAVDRLAFARHGESMIGWYPADRFDTGATLAALRWLSARELAGAIDG